jgi:uncharacterized membrane protein
LEEMDSKKSSSRTRETALAAVIAALYAAAVYFFAPISFQIVQVRIADVLLPLSVIFGPPAIIGLTLGNFIGNFASPFGIIDVVGGTLANLVASTIAWQVAKRSFKGAWVTAVLLEALTITLIVGTYLAYLIEVPIWTGWLYVVIGELIAVSLGGYVLLKALKRATRRPLHEMKPS